MNNINDLLIIGGFVLFIALVMNFVAASFEKAIDAKRQENCPPHEWDFNGTVLECKKCKRSEYEL